MRLPQRIGVGVPLVLALLAAGCSTGARHGAAPDTDGRLTIRNHSTHGIKVYTTPDAASVERRLGTVVIGEQRTFRLPLGSHRLFVIIEFPNGLRLTERLPVTMASAFDVSVEPGARRLSLRY